MIAEEIRGKELRSHVVVVDIFLRGGISHEKAEDIVAVSELHLFEEGGGYNVFAGVCHSCVKKRDQPKVRSVVRSIVDLPPIPNKGCRRGPILGTYSDQGF